MNTTHQVFAGGWKQLQHAEQIDSTVIPSVDFPASISWKPDGTKFILLVAANPDFIREYNTLTPWVTTGATAGASFTVNPPESNPRGMYITLDGSKCFIIGTGDDEIIQFNFGTKWDVSTLFDSGISVVPSGLDSSPQGMTFSKDGLRCYITDSTSDIMEYTMTVSFDLSTFNIIPVNTVDLSANTLLTRELVIKPDGKFLYIISGSFETVSRYFLPTKNSLLGMIFVDELDLSAIANNIRGIFIRENDGKKLYIINAGNDTIFTFDMSLETNNAIINNDGDELITNLGEVLVH